MNRRELALVVSLPVLVVASPGRAETNLVVRSHSECPSGQAVSEILWSIRPDREWPALAATIEVAADRVRVRFGEDREHWREIPAPADCADRASRAALVIAAWSGELPAHATSAPTLSVAVPPPVPVVAAPAKRHAIYELGLSGSYSMVGGMVPGARIELARFGRQAWWGVRAAAAYQTAKSLHVSIGTSRYDRTLLGARLVLRWDGGRIFLSSDGGLAGSFVRAHGDGYARNESASGLNLGLAADGRVGVRWGRFRVWAEGLLYRWVGKESIRVDPLSVGSPSTSGLPRWDAHVGLGAGVVFD